MKLEKMNIQRIETRIIKAKDIKGGEYIIIPHEKTIESRYDCIGRAKTEVTWIHKHKKIIIQYQTYNTEYNILSKREYETLDMEEELIQIINKPKLKNYIGISEGI